MRSSPVLAGFLLCFSAASGAQEELTPTPLTERIKAKMADNLRGLPDYICTQTVERRIQRAGESRLVDTQQLEMAQVDGKELRLTAAISEVAFALLTRDIFLTGSPEFALAEG